MCLHLRQPILLFTARRANDLILSWFGQESRIQPSYPGTTPRHNLRVKIFGATSTYSASSASVIPGVRQSASTVEI